MQSSLEESKKLMKPVIAECFDRLGGACDYFSLLERQNERFFEPHQPQDGLNNQEPLSQSILNNQPAVSQDDNLVVQNGVEQTQYHHLPKGYPQKHMYKTPKIDADRCQANLTEVHDQKVTINQSYLGSRAAYLKDAKTLGHAVVYANQDKNEVVEAMKAECNNSGESPQFAGQVKFRNISERLAQKRRKKRSLSAQFEPVTFTDHLDNQPRVSAQALPDQVMVKPTQIREKQTLISGHKGLKQMKDQFWSDRQQRTANIARKDFIMRPGSLKPEPVMIYDARKDALNEKEYDEYLSFCVTVMREAPISGGPCGIWLRGSSMIQENALKLLAFYKYNVDLAKLHVLYPMVMNDPQNRETMIQLGKQHPEQLKREIQNAVIDLNGCKQSEIEEIVKKFRDELDERITEERLSYHRAILQKVKIETPPDIEDRIKESLEFSREIKKKFNLQFNGFAKNSANQPNDKKLKLTELEDLHVKQRSFCLITGEMNLLDQLLLKARQWIGRVNSIRGQPVSIKQIETIYLDGKNMPINFEERMDEIKNRKKDADDLNHRISEVLVVRKTRKRVVDNGSKKADHAVNDSQEIHDTREQYFRQLLDESRKLFIQSDQINKLKLKVSEINQWKRDVIHLFKNHEQESQDFKRYQQHYKGKLSRSQAFNVDLQLMNVLQRKGALIEWREKVEEMTKKLTSGEQSHSLMQVCTLLQEGVEKGFLENQSSGFQLSSVIMSQVDTFIIFQEQYDEPNSQNEMESVKESMQVYAPLLSNFSMLEKLNQTYIEAVGFDVQIKAILRSLNIYSSSQVSEDDLMITADVQDLKFEDLLELETKGKQIRIELDSFKDFLTFLQTVKSSIEQCESYLQTHSSEGVGFKVNDLVEFQKGLEIMKLLVSQKINSNALEKIQIETRGYIDWLRISEKLLRNYGKALALKLQSSVLVVDNIVVNDIAQENPFELDSDHESLKALVSSLNESKFEFMRETDQGKNMMKLLEMTNNAVQGFETQRSSKKTKNFDVVEYIRVIESLCQSSLPIEKDLIEQARLELKREKWIKKFHDLQSPGNHQSQVSLGQNDSQSLNSRSAGQQQQNVRLKQLDALAKEFRSSSDLQNDQECSQLAQQLERQQKACQQWKDQFDELFNDQGQFDPKKGNAQITELLEKGEALELRLQEFIELQAHTDRMSEWKSIIKQIFGSDTITLEALDRHIRETNSLSDRANPDYCNLLESLKELATIWKIRAKTILKIRPIDLSYIMKGETFNDSECFCICRQPENGLLMIRCDFCEIWYHYSCIGLQDIKLLEKAQYKCISCAIRDGLFAQTVQSDYCPVIPTRNQVFKELKQTQQEAGSLANFFFEQTQGTPRWVYQEEMQELRDETEKILLDHFFTKQRISVAEFEHILWQGTNSIPLHLEELQRLQVIEACSQTWRLKADESLRKGPQTQQLWSNFKNINGFVEKVNNQEVQQLQDLEKQFDQSLIELIVQSESFPMVLPQCRKLVQILQFRDWVRECFLIIVQLDTCNQVPKLSKIKLRKHLKRLIIKGELLIGMNPDFLPVANEQKDVSRDLYLEVLKNLLVQGSEIESNVILVAFLFSNLGGKHVSQGRILDLSALRPLLRGENCNLTEGLLITRLEFYTGSKVVILDQLPEPQPSDVIAFQQTVSQKPANEDEIIISLDAIEEPPIDQRNKRAQTGDQIEILYEKMISYQDKLQQDQDENPELPQSQADLDGQQIILDEAKAVVEEAEDTLRK